MAEVTSRRQNRSGQQARQQILAAALKLFADRGYVGTSLADVAAEAEVSKPSILYHFPDKERLWIAAVEGLWNEVEDYFTQSWPRELAPSRRLLEAMLDLFIEAAIRWPAYIRIPFIEGMTPSWRSEWLVDRHFRNHVGLNDRILRGMQRKGLLPAGDPALLQAMLTSAINVLVAQGAMWDRTYGRSLHDRDALRAAARVTIERMMITSES